MYSWGGAAAGRDPQPRLTRLPAGVVTEALPRLSKLTYLQLGALCTPAAAQLTCLAPTLQLLSLFDQDAPTGGLPSPPVKADWPLLASYSADWEFLGRWAHYNTGKQVLGAHTSETRTRCIGGTPALAQPCLLKRLPHRAQVGANLLNVVGCTLTYGAATSATGRAVDVTAEVTLERHYYDRGTLASVLAQLLPAGPALTQLTLRRQHNTDSLATLCAPALSELEALTLTDCYPACLGPLAACTPHLSSLAFTYASFWYLGSAGMTALPPAVAALPLRRVQLQGADLVDLPPGRWLEGALPVTTSLWPCFQRLWCALLGWPPRFAGGAVCGSACV